MDRNDVIRMLKRYELMRAKRDALRDMIADAQERMVSIRGVSCDSTPVMGGGNRYEINLCSRIDRIDKMREEYEALDLNIHTLQIAMASLCAEEMDILDKMFIHPIYAAHLSLSRKLNCSVATVYRIKDKALDTVIEALPIAEYVYSKIEKNMRKKEP